MLQLAYKHRTFVAAAYPFFLFLVLFYCKIYYYLTIYHIETAPVPSVDNQQVLYPQECVYQEAPPPSLPPPPPLSLLTHNRRPILFTL